MYHCEFVITLPMQPLFSSNSEYCIAAKDHAQFRTDDNTYV